MDCSQDRQYRTFASCGKPWPPAPAAEAAETAAAEASKSSRKISGRKSIRQRDAILFSFLGLNFRDAPCSTMLTPELTAVCVAAMGTAIGTARDGKS